MATWHHHGIDLAAHANLAVVIGAELLLLHLLLGWLLHLSHHLLGVGHVLLNRWQKTTRGLSSP